MKSQRHLGLLYIRPTIIGTEPNIGAAATPTAEALLFVVNCPVGDYFKVEFDHLLCSSKKAFRGRHLSSAWSNLERITPWL